MPPLRGPRPPTGNPGSATDTIKNNRKVLGILISIQSSDTELIPVITSVFIFIYGL